MSIDDEQNTTPDSGTPYNYPCLWCGRGTKVTILTKGDVCNRCGRHFVPDYRSKTAWDRGMVYQWTPPEPAVSEDVPEGFPPLGQNGMHSGVGEAMAYAGNQMLNPIADDEVEGLKELTLEEGVVPENPDIDAEIAEYEELGRTPSEEDLKRRTWRYSSKPMRKRKENDAYFMRDDLPIAALRAAVPPMLAPELVLDPGAGAGAWGNAAKELWPNAHLVGVDIDGSLPMPNSYDDWITGNFLEQDFSDYGFAGFDLIIGNPPYGKNAEPFIRHGLAQLRTGGMLVFLLLLPFLESQTRWRTMYGPNGNCRPTDVWVCSKRPGFEGYEGTDQRSYAIFVFQKGANPPTFNGHWLMY